MVVALCASSSATEEFANARVDVCLVGPLWSGSDSCSSWLVCRSINTDADKRGALEYEYRQLE
jgi:hypothetical protein